jgi:hypothetical protein
VDICEIFLKILLADGDKKMTGKFDLTPKSWTD